MTLTYITYTQIYIKDVNKKEIAFLITAYCTAFTLSCINEMKVKGINIFNQLLTLWKIKPYNTEKNS